MTTKAELKKQIEALQAEYAAMPDEPEPLFEVVDVRDRYWFVDELLQVSPITYSNDSYYDREQIKLGNHFTDKAEAERMAAFIKKNFLYWRMALRFADEYEFEDGGYNYFVFKNKQSFHISWARSNKTPANIYMTFKNTQEFAEFCNEHKKELGL